MSSSVQIESSTATRVIVDGVERLAFAGCDYLGLAHHPAVVEAARAELAAGGVTTAASRATTGQRPVHARLEHALAELVGTEAALVTADGYLADLAVLQALRDDVSVALLDADAHPSLFDAVRVGGARAYDYGPGDLSRAHALLDRFGGEGVAVLTDGTFPMHGRIAACADLLRLLPPDGWLVVDDSHTLGVLGDGGRGTLEVFGLDDPRVVVTASLAKGLGAAGGVIAGSASVIERARHRADAFVGTTALPPAMAAAALAATDVLQREPERVERLHANVAQLHQLGRRLGRPLRGSFLPVLPLPAGDAERGERLTRGLLERGLFVPTVRYPGAGDRCLLRISVNSEHTAADLFELEEALAALLPPPAP